MERMYFITRRDLSAGQQSSQLVHSAIDFVLEHTEICRKWHVTSNTVVLATVANEQALRELALRALDKDLTFIEVREPDMGGQLTAIALEPAAATLTRGLPLLFSL